jgi:hypothetical protein
MLKRKTQIYNISSKDSENGSFKSQVRVQLPDLNFSYNNTQNVYLSVQHCEVPNSFYVINYTNNSIVIDNVVYTLLKGNYNATTFINMITSIIPNGFNIAYSTTTNKYTWTNSTTDFTINASHPECKINSVIGLGSTDVTSISKTLELPYVVNFLPIQRINFRSNFFTFRNYTQADNSSDVFLSVQNNAPQQAIIYYKNDSNIKYLVEDKSITSFLISVTNDVNQPINFNNIDWFLTFQIDIEFIEYENNLDFTKIINSNNNLYLE